ncbi:MAG: ABC transporter permease [Desulfurococcales archaeon]|nr:ABC transporter permease [Desulfurococcales archaeon]
MVEAGRRLARLYTYALIAALYAPIVVMAAYSFDDSKFFGVWGGFTARWYRLLAHDPQAWEALRNSVAVAVASALISTALALPAALSTRKVDRDLASLLTYPPVIMPEITEAVALMIMFLKLGFPLGVVSVVIGHTAFNVAYAYVALTPAGSSGARLAMAARTLGAGPLEAFLRVAVPVSMPGIVAALALTFMMSFTDFTKTLFTKGPGFVTLPILIWNRARRPGLSPYTSQPAIAALSTVLVAMSIAVAFTFTLYQARRQPGRGGA